MTLVAGFLTLRNPPDEATAIRVGSAAGSAPAPAPQSFASFEAAPAPSGAISLPQLVRELQARAATSTTRPKTTATTKKPAATAPSTTRPSSPTTTTTGPPARQAAPATTTTAVLSPLPTIVQAVVPPAVAVAGAVTRTDSGVASWFNAPDGTCAHRTLPMGTMIKVTRVHNGASTRCKVNDRGPTLATGRLIDLSLDTFEKLAAREAGLIDVNIEW